MAIADCLIGWAAAVLSAAVLRPATVIVANAAGIAAAFGRALSVADSAGIVGITTASRTALLARTAVDTAGNVWRRTAALVRTRYALGAAVHR